jgi:hypothetical protein
VFALLTWIMLEPPFRSQRFDFLLRPTFFLVVPGALTSEMIGGSVHIGSTWLAAIANFAFYFGLTYLAFTIWLRRRADARKND